MYQSIFYNNLDLVGKISRDSSTLVNYSYLSDGTKLSALNDSGEGLVYRGPFVYRKSSDDSSLTLESAAFSGGRMTPDGDDILFLWNLYNQHEKEEQAEKEDFNENQSNK